MTNSEAPAGSPWNPEHAQPDATHHRPQGSFPQPPVAVPVRHSRRRRPVLVGGGAALAAALLVGGVAVGRATDTVDGVGTTAQAASNGTGSSSTSTGTGTGSGSGTGSTGTGGTGTGGTGSGTGYPGTTSSASNGPAASGTQEAGIVTVVSTLGYEDAESAGTGLVVTSTGEILTNNHVINGATSVKVTVVSTGATYTASVVGTDPTDDIAVLQLSKADGLTTAKLAAASSVRTLAVGDTVVGVGNAGGTGTLTAASGKVTAVNQSITATDDDGSNAESLTGLIETDADIVAGDSGGPLYDSAGAIVGIDTAGATSNGSSSGAYGTSYGSTTGTSAAQSYAIPITSALEIAGDIESGVQTSTIHLGAPAFLGVGVAQNATGGAGVSSVLSGGPAAGAGITAGSVITAIDGKSVTSSASLKTRLAAYEPGQKVSVTWTDSSGRSHTASVTLATGPAD